MMTLLKPSHLSPLLNNGWEWDTFMDLNTKKSPMDEYGGGVSGCCGGLRWKNIRERKKNLPTKDISIQGVWNIKRVHYILNLPLFCGSTHRRILPAILLAGLCGPEVKSPFYYLNPCIQPKPPQISTARLPSARLWLAARYTEGGYRGW